MSTGRIQFAEQDGTFVLKFVGEVRLTLCSALDATIERIFTALNFSTIVIDLTETESIDSTTLGLLANPVATESGPAAYRRDHQPGYFPAVAIDGVRSGIQHRRPPHPVPRMPV